jgi:hypothetical protein
MSPPNNHLFNNTATWDLLDEIPDDPASAAARGGGAGRELGVS